MNKTICRVPNNYNEKENVLVGLWDGETYKEIETDNTAILMSQLLMERRDDLKQEDWGWVAESARYCAQITTRLREIDKSVQI